MDAIKPTVTQRSGAALSGEVYQHPAFGIIRVSRPSGARHLFGSELVHQHAVHIEICEAELQRDLNHNWIFGRRVIAEFSMSEAQWAHFVASAGMHEGTPITFERKPAAGCEFERVPGIAPIETQHQQFEREMRDYTAKALERANGLRRKIAELHEGGKANKGQLAELVKELDGLIVGLPNTVSYIQSQFADAMEKTVQAGKTEIESFVLGMATQTGLEVLRTQSPQLPLQQPAQE